jgi:autotransporter-associated beta strand protein
MNYRRHPIAIFLILGLTLIGILPVMAQRPLGIDVSSYQGAGVNWSSVKSSGRIFAWAKATEGTYDDDADFVGNENNGKAAGMVMGAYHFARPDLNSPATEESFFWAQAGNYILADGKTLMPMLDLETFNGVVGASSYSAWANTWCDDVVVSAANLGVTVKPFLYSSSCHFSYFDSSVSQWISDVANYGSVDGTADPQSGTPWSSCAADDPWGSSIWHVWQYASAAPDGTVPGVSGACDVDVFNGTATQFSNTCIATVNGSSAVYYWDPQKGNTSNPYTGSMSGVWESNLWSGSSSPASSPLAWVESKAACFGVNTGTGTPAYTVTMNSGHVVAGFFDGGLAPGGCNVTINGTGAILLTSGAQAFDSQGTLAVLTINTSIGGTGQLVPEGTGQSYLNASNTYTGGTALGYVGVPFSGTVNFSNGAAFGTGTFTFQTNGNGGALAAEGTTAMTITNTVSVVSPTTNNIAANTAPLTFTGPWTIGAAFGLGVGGTAASSLTISGNVSGSAALYKYNPGILTLSGANSFSGAINNSAGTLTIGDPGKIGNGAYGNTITNSGTFNYSSTASQTLSGIISGAGPLNQTAGTLTLSAANTYTGATTVSGGTLVLGVNNAIPSGSSLLIGPGGLLNMNGKNVSVATLGGTLGANAPAGNVTNNNGTLTINGTSVTNAGQQGTAAYSGVISGTGSVVISGGGTTTFSGSNLYTGATTVSGGTFSPTISAAVSSSSGLTVNSPATLDILNRAISLPSLAGSGTVYVESGTLTVGTANTSPTFTGVIANAATTYNNGASVNGLQGFYYPNINFSGTPIIRTDANVNFSNLATNTQPLYPQVTEFSVRWLGQVLTTTAGTYTFSTTSDDGSRCWVNGVLVADNWAFQGPTTRGGTITLAANTLYDIRVEYEQGTVGAACTLSWTPPGGSSAAIPSSNLFTYAGVGGIAKTGTGKLTLNGVNTYAGSTAINNGTLALGASASINNSSAISIGAGGTFDVSAIASYTLSSSATLTASGTASPATIKGGTTVSLGSRPITLNFDGTDPALTISQGTLALNGNAFTVNGSLLPGGTYTLVQQTSGNISSSGTLTVAGSAIPSSGATVGISASGGSVILTITYNTATTVGALTPVTYGTPVTFLATVSPSPTGGTVQFYDNSAPLGGAIPVSGGMASYSTNALQVGFHPITASFSGAPYYNASATLGATNQEIDPAPLSVTALDQSTQYGIGTTFGPGSTNFSSSGLQNGETVGSVTLAVSGNGGSPSAPVGTYTITPSAATNGTFLPSDYNITYNPGTLTVTLPPNTIPVTIIDILLLTNGTVQMDFSGTPGYVYTIEAATDLTQPINWTALSTNAADTNGMFSFIDTNVTNFSGRFYQTVAH